MVCTKFANKECSMKKKFFILIFGCCCCCNQQQPKTSLITYNIEKALDMENKIVWLDSICDSITIIPLETSEEILIGKFHRAYLHNDLLFILHDNKCSVFDLTGKYLRNIGKLGQGPGEYNSIESIFFNNEKIYINEFSGNRFFCYTLDGEFINKIQVSTNFENITFIDENVVVGFVYPFPNNLNRIIFFNKNGDYIDSVSHSEQYDSKKNGFSQSDGRFFSFNGNKYLKEGYNDTVFRVEKKFNLYPEYIINTGKYTVTYKDRIEWEDKYEKGKTINVYYESDDHIILKESRSFKYDYIFIEKQSATIDKVRFYYNDEICKHFLKEIEYAKIPAAINIPDEMYISGGDIKRHPLMIDDGSPSFEILYVSEDNMTLVGKEKPLNIDDNPVIVLVHLKQ